MTESPAFKPLTLLVVSTVAMLLSEDDHVPWAVVLLSCVVEPTHILVMPVIAATAGNGISVIFMDAVLEQNDEVTVTL